MAHSRLVPRLAGDALQREFNMLPLTSTQYIHDGKPPKYAEWLDKHPATMSVNPHGAALKWKTYNPKSVDISGVHTFRYRDYIYRCAVYEKQTYDYLRKFHCSASHQRGLNERLLAATELKLLREIAYHKLYTVLLHEGKITRGVISGCQTNAPHIWRHFATVIVNGRELIRDTPTVLSMWMKVQTLQSKRLHGLSYFHYAVKQYKIKRHRQEIIHELLQNGLIRCLKAKESRDSGKLSIENFKGLKENLREATGRLLWHLKAHIASVLKEMDLYENNADPTRWYTESIFTVGIVRHAAAQRAYADVLETFFRGTGNKDRYYRFATLHKLLTSLLYEFPSLSPGNPEVRICHLFEELSTIRRYRASKYPESITRWEITHARKFYMDFLGRSMVGLRKLTMTTHPEDLETLGCSPSTIEWMDAKLREARDVSLSGLPQKWNQTPTRRAKSKIAGDVRPKIRRSESKPAGDVKPKRRLLESKSVGDVNVSDVQEAREEKIKRQPKPASKPKARTKRNQDGMDMYVAAMDSVTAAQKRQGL